MSLRQADYLSRGSPTECGVSECDREALTIRRPCSTTSCRAIGKKIIVYIHIYINKKVIKFIVYFNYENITLSLQVVDVAVNIFSSMVYI